MMFLVILWRLQKNWQKIQTIALYAGKKWNLHENYHVHIFSISKFKILTIKRFKIYLGGKQKINFSFNFSSCLQSWLEQDTSCPTCRLTLSMGAPGTPRVDTNDSVVDTQVAIRRTPNHFFHFDGNYYKNIDKTSRV